MHSLTNGKGFVAFDLSADPRCVDVVTREHFVHWSHFSEKNMDHVGREVQYLLLVQLRQPQFSHYFNTNSSYDYVITVISLLP
jgi:hypothetical protein